MLPGLSFFISLQSGVKTVTRQFPRRDFLICGALSLLTFAAYWGVHRNEFVNFDDPNYITYNPIVFRGLTWAGAKWAFTTGAASNWHPLTWLSLMLDCQLFGERVGLHHLENVLWHIANAILLFAFLKRSTAEAWRSAMVAALFALHPLHVESVAWASERKDVLSTFWGLLAMHSYVGYTRRPGAVRNLATIVFYLLSLLSKPMLVTLPFLLLLLDFWPLRRWTVLRSKSPDKPEQAVFVRLLQEKWPLFILSAASSVVTFLVQRAGGAMMSPQLAPLHARLGNAVIAYGAYLGKMIWPRDLAVLYPYPETLSPYKVAAVSSMLLLITVIVLRMKPMRPYLFTGWFWYLGSLVPVIGFIQVGTQAMADRYTYVSLVGIFIMVVWGISDLVQWRHRAPVLIASGVAVIVACFAVTSIQVGYWKDSLALFQHSLEISPNSAVAHHNLGHALFMQGRYGEAVAEFEKALQIWPGYSQAHYNLANSLNLNGRLNEAVEHYDRALELNPEYTQAHYGLAATLATMGKFPQAREHFQEALRLKPDYAEAHTKFANLLMIEGETNEAKGHYLAAIAAMPENQEAHSCFAALLALEKQYPAAVDQYRKAIALKTNNISALNDLAWILATAEDPTVHNPTEAVQLAERACGMSGFKDAAYLDTLAAAYSETGRFPEAIEMTRKAAAMARIAGKEQLAAQIEGRIRFYEQHISYRAMVKMRVTAPAKS